MTPAAPHDRSGDLPAEEVLSPKRSGEEIASSLRRRLFALLLLFSLLVAGSPLFAAGVGVLLGAGGFFDETGPGAYLWLLVLTVPLGGFGVLVALVARYARFARRNR
jgi:hypothetical protein